MQRSAIEVQAPDWWRQAIVYSIFIDRFRRGATDGTWPHPLPAEKVRHGGDLWGVMEALPHIQSLGATVLHLTPASPAPSAHRYDAVDPRAIDVALGGEEALRTLCARARERGIRVLLDLPVTHVHRDFFAFRDVQARGFASPYAGWFRLRRFPFLEGPDPGYEHYQKGQWQEPLLNLADEEVQDYLCGTFVHLSGLGVDGFRIDAAADVPLSLLARIRAALPPQLVLFGEVVPENVHSFTTAGLTGATDFGVQRTLLDWLLHQRGDAAACAAALERRRFWRGGPGWSALAFTATHDQHRLRSLCADPRLARLAQLIVLCRGEVPLLYYGDEVGLRSDETGRDFEDCWPDRRPMDWDERNWDQETLLLLREALRLRRDCAALRCGDEQVQGDGQVLVIRRWAGDEIVELYAHGAAGQAEVSLLSGAPSLARPLLTLGEAAVDGPVLRLGSYSALVLRRDPTDEVAALWQDLATHNRHLCAQAFVSGALQCASLPVSLYLTVTEACNLRCLHCITDAPARTRSGRARTMQPWLIQALLPALAAADYVAFAHGGESLVAPIFWHLLAATTRARAGRSSDVHLLSNGALLNEATLRRLMAEGVTSLAVSLDGARAATNDAIRLGGRFEDIVANIRRALRLRTEMGVDLRIGISSVVALDNVAELDDLGALIEELGVDWLKLEEMYPVNGFSRRQLLPMGDEGTLAAINRLRRRLEPLGVVVVDHLAPPQGCPCDAERVPGLRAFREADDFANRARFHPCSMAWEQACIDPDGTVHPVDYGHPAIGNLSESPLPALWNGEPMQRLRRDALRRTPQHRRCPRGR